MRINDFLAMVHEGVIVDVSDVVEDWSIITPKHITDRMEVKRGDILILHTGYHRYYEGKPQQDLTRYFCMHPGGTRELAQWMHDMQISWWGVDAGSGDHPMNTTIRYMRPDLTRRFGDFVAVDSVSFRIERGEIFGFLGSNGCGKTTTMKMLTGLLPATAGDAP